MAETVEFACPRCGTEVSEQFYGPCTSCRAELRAKYLGEGRDVEVAEYVPKMNVTPNAVALKDD
jgi:NMD protein affecting ribosome stability and mRNA decay